LLPMPPAFHRPRDISAMMRGARSITYPIDHMYKKR
jgi:hypothetical protein